MTRFALYFIKVIIAFFASLMLNSCTNHTIDFIPVEPEGEIITKNVTLNESFDKIYASNDMNVIITQANETRIEVEAHKNLFEYIDIYVEDETLHIKKNKDFKYNTTHNVYVAMPEIKAIKATSASHVTATNSITSKKIDFYASSAAAIDIELIAQNIDVEAKSAAQITLIGKVINLQIKSSSAALVKAENLISKNATVKASSAANVTVNALTNLDAKASSGADIFYESVPTNLIMQNKSGGNIQSLK